jgi:gamma-glutamylcysteine synthetase
MENEVKIILFDINKFCIEREETLYLDELLKDAINSLKENKNIGKKYIEVRGLKIKPVEEVNFSVIDINKFLFYIVSLLFKDYHIIDCQNQRSERGHPDLILEKDNNKIYLEIKFGEDSLRLNQLRWFSENKNKICKILNLSVCLNSKSEIIYENSL